jgi:hypothetical protein
MNNDTKNNTLKIAAKNGMESGTKQFFLPVISLFKVIKSVFNKK